MLHPPMNAKRNNLLKMTSVGGSSTKLSKFLTQGGDSSTFFFNLLFRLIFVFFLCWKLAISSFSKAASIDSSLLSCPAYCWRRKLRDPQISSSDALGLMPSRLYGSQTLIRGNLGTLPKRCEKEKTQINLTVATGWVCPRKLHTEKTKREWPTGVCKITYANCYMSHNVIASTVNYNIISKPPPWVPILTVYQDRCDQERDPQREHSFNRVKDWM